MVIRLYKRFLSISALAIVGCCLFQSCGSSENTGDPNPKVDKLKLQPGFVAEHLYSPSENEQGAWVSMTFDDKRRYIASDQYEGLYSIDVHVNRAQDSLQGEELGISWRNDCLVMGYERGLLYALNSLYVVSNNKPNPNFRAEPGVYRLFDTDGDGQ